MTELETTVAEELAAAVEKTAPQPERRVRQESERLLLVQGQAYGAALGYQRRLASDRLKAQDEAAERLAGSDYRALDSEAPYGP